MNGKFFHAETVETPVRCIKIRFEKAFAPSHPGDATEEPLLSFEEFVNRHLAKGYLHFTLDLENIPLPTTRLIALLIALTVRVRRRQGEIKLINVSSTASNNFSTFSALNFLTIAPEVAPVSKTLTDTTPQTRARPRHEEMSTNITRLKPAAAAEIKSASPLKPVPPVVVPISEVNDTTTIRFAQTEPFLAAVVPAAAVQSPNQTTPQINPLFDDDAAAGLTEIAEPPLVEEFASKIDDSPPADKEKKFQLRVESHTANLYQLCDFVTAHAFAAGLNEKESAKIKIAVYEACLNVIEHAYHSRPGEWIDLSVRYSPERFMIIIQDNGLSFEMKPPKDYDVQEVIDERRSGGFGLHIIRRAMDSVEYLPDVINGNRLVMVKKLK